MTFLDLIVFLDINSLRSSRIFFCGGLLKVQHLCKFSHDPDLQAANPLDSWGGVGGKTVSFEINSEQVSKG